MEFKNKGNFAKAVAELKNDKNNAVAQVFDDFSNSNKGSLSNVVFTLKNNYAKKNGTTDGSSNLLTNFKPGYNATILDKLINCGGLLVATTNLDEFGLGGTGQYSNMGLILNPLDNNYLVGGSSSGAAATFTHNIGFAIGSDTGDSVRLPASNIGKVGFKPSYGAVSRYGLFAYASSLDTVAWFTHNVNDTIILASVLFGQDKKDLTSTNIDVSNIQKIKPKKIAYLNCFNELNDDVAIAYKKVIDKLSKDNSIELIKIEPNIELLNAIKTVYDVISFAEASSNLSNLNGVHFGNRIEGNSWEESFKNTRSNGFGFMVQRRLALGSYYLEKNNQEEIFIRAQKVRRLISNWFNEVHDKCDIFIYPSSASAAPLKNSKVEFVQKYMNYILTASNLVGNPSIGIKLGQDKNNMPFNLTIDAKIYNDKHLLEHALFMEETLNEGDVQND